MQEEILIADSGSTKTDWCTVSAGRVTGRYATQGINPFQQSKAVIEAVINRELKLQMPAQGRVGQVFFYGAGCREEMRLMMMEVLQSAFTTAAVIEVNSDLLAAARALCGCEAGVACILGTGANSCLYDGARITANTPPLGYVLGDEGSGAVLGRNFINALFKGRMPASLTEAFTVETGMTVADVIRKVYREPLANRFLASLSLFISRHISAYDELRTLVIDNFRLFFRNNVRPYEVAAGASCKQLLVGAVGSMAFFYRSELEAAAAIEGFKVGKILRSPMDGLVDFHGK